MGTTRDGKTADPPAVFYSLCSPSRTPREFSNRTHEAANEGDDSDDDMSCHSGILLQSVLGATLAVTALGRSRPAADATHDERSSDRPAVLI